MPVPYVILVGGPGDHKRDFLFKFTQARSDDTEMVIAGMTKSPFIVFVDTPGQASFRDKETYSWDGVFGYADLIVNFGDWLPSEVYGIPSKKSPPMITWSGNHSETLKRIMSFLQKKCSLYGGYSSEPW